jgi:glycogen(starch) synthase
MKVLMLGWELPPHNSGGLGVACLQLSKALADHGADIEFILPHYAGEKPNFMKVTTAFSKSTPLYAFENAYASYMYKQAGERTEYFNISDQQNVYEHAVRSIISKREFDIIHAHDWLTFRAALQAKWQTGKPLVVHIHSIERDRAGGQEGNPLVREIEATAMTLADRVIAVSGKTKQAIIDDYGIPADKIEIIHNSIDPSYFEPISGDNEYKYLSDLKRHGWKVVVNIGRLTIQKGLPHFIQAAAEVIKKEPRTIFLLVGSGEQRDELIELAAGLGIADKVIFAGFQRGKRWRDAYAIGDLFVMPSVSEPFGLTPLEAICYGSPVLISKQSGVAEVLQNCLKVDYWDIKGMANQIVGALQNESLRYELLKNSQKEFKRLSWNQSAGNIMTIYKGHMTGVAA